MTRTKTLILLAAFSFASSGVNAAVISWVGSTNDVVSASSDITNIDTFTTSSGFQSPALGTNGYPGPNLQSPNFYAATSFGSGDGFQIFNGGGNDLLGRIQDFGANGAGIDYSSMIVWDLPAGTTFETAAISGFGDFGGADGNGSYRYLVQTNDNSWYASNAFVLQNSSITAALEDWFAYTPHNAGVPNIDGTAIAGASLDFSNANLVGYFQEFTTAGGGGVFIVSYEADGTIIPEPASLALLSLLGLAFCGRRR